MFYNRALFADSQLDDKEKVESNFLPAAIMGGLFSADGRKGGEKNPKLFNVPHVTRRLFMCYPIFLYSGETYIS